MDNYAELPDEIKAALRTIEQSLKVQEALPSVMLKGQPKRSIRSNARRKRDDDTGWIDRTYDGLDGDWADWLDTARAYDRSIPAQDRYDLRHNILLELLKARARDNAPLPKLRQYRIASLCRVNYWRELGKGQQRLCIIDGMPTEPHCRDCQNKPTHGRCPWLAVRPMLSLDLEVEDSEGETTTLGDTIADDKALDLEAWNDAVTWLLGCPTRLVEIADKIRNDKALSGAERKYLWKWRTREQKRLI